MTFYEIQKGGGEPLRLVFFFFLLSLPFSSFLLLLWVSVCSVSVAAVRASWAGGGYLFPPLTFFEPPCSSLIQAKVLP